jgi:hypothetical protein
VEEVNGRFVINGQHLNEKKKIKVSFTNHTRYPALYVLLRIAQQRASEKAKANT